MEGTEPPAPRPRLEFTPRRAGDVLTTGFEVFGLGWRVLLATAAIATIPLTIAQTAFATWLLSQAGVIREAGTETAPAEFWAAFAATIGAAVVDFAVALLVQAAATRAVGAILVGREPSVAESYRAALSRLGPVLGATLLIALGVMGGFILLVVPGFFLMVRWLVSVPAIVLERRGAIEGMRRSWGLVRGEGWHAFAVLIVVLLLSTLASQGVARLFPVDVLWQGVGSAITQTVVLPFATAVYVVLYVNLCVAKEGMNAEILEQELDR